MVTRKWKAVRIYSMGLQDRIRRRNKSKVLSSLQAYWSRVSSA